MIEAPDVPGPRTAPNGEPIMGAKFCIPVIRPSLVLRGRLLDCLSEGVRGVLTLISAPAGSGKSVLASSWVHAGRAPGPVAWLSLDEEDDRPGVFWTYVLAALARSEVPVGGIGTPEVEDSIDHSLLVRLAVSLSERSAPVVLVLDNVEVLTRQQIADALDFVVRHAAGQLRLVLIARTDPNLPLHRYRLDGSVTEIRFPDLAFTYEEAQELLRRRDVQLPDEAVQAFAYHTRGWAAGLRLADTELDGRRNGTATDSDMAAYFRAEVLDAQPPDVRAFLLTTSVVDHLPPDLAIQLSGSPEGATSLRALAKAKTFVEQCVDQDECYQYHPLVRNLLRAELRIQSAAQRRRLHRRAASWLAAAGRFGEAALQCAAAEDWREAACLMIRGFRVPSVLAADLPEVSPDVLAQMPISTPGPEAAVVAAALAWRENDLTSCEKSLARADELLAGAEAADGALALRLAAAVTSAVLAAACGAADETLAAAGTIQQLMSRLATEGIVPPPQVRALALWSTGCVHLGRGDLALAREILAAAARTANIPGYTGLRARCLAQLALAEALSGRLVSATETAHRAIIVSERCEGPAGSQTVAADVALAWVSAERGDTAQARALADGACAVLEVWPDPNCLGVLSLIHVRLQRARGDLVGARVAVERGHKSRPPMQVPVWLSNRLTIAEALLLMTPGHSDAAAELLRRSGLIESTEGLLAYGWARLADDVCEAVRIAKHVLEQPGVALDVRVGAVLLNAAGELETSRQDAARSIVDQALALAEPQGLRRPFEEIPPRLRAILRGRAEGANHWLAGSGAGRGGAAAAGTVAVVQPLTEREQEVLGYLAELMPTEEIAARMFVSVNTVKTHVRAILRKLSAERRNDAVRRARELGLL